MLPGKPAVLVAWTQSNRVSFLDVQNGTQLGELSIEPPKTDEPDRRSDGWQAFIKTLIAPSGVALPYVHTAQASIYLSVDGRMRLYHTGGADLFLEIDGKETKLEAGETPFLAAALDRSLGLLAALDSEAKLHIYQQRIRVGIFDTGLKIVDEFRPALVMSADGTVLFVTDGHNIVVVESSGRVRQRQELYYTLGAINCSPDGHRFVTSDLDANVIRIYDGNLGPTHQRFAVDLLADARRTQLLSTAAMASAALGPLAINNKGVLAFGLSGVLCVTNLLKMKAFPKAQ
jgi:hypothetical protein